MKIKYRNAYEKFLLGDEDNEFWFGPKFTFHLNYGFSLDKIITIPASKKSDDRMIKEIKKRYKKVDIIKDKVYYEGRL